MQAKVLKNGLRTTDYEAWWDSLEWLVKLTLLELFDVADRGVMGGGLYNHVKLPTFVRLYRVASVCKCCRKIKFCLFLI